ncbi:MAG: hypothetical protein LW832_01590 [Parachlamydia sp.]|jgi:fucose permease|nr:hypothetical protein [Parachlamydia sp.]
MQVLNSTSLQAYSEQALGNTVKNATMELLQTISQAGRLGPHAFVEKYVTSKQAPLSHLDERTSQFFHKMMGAVNEQLKPFSNVLATFEVIGIMINMPNLKDKYVQGIAFPHIQQLYNEFEAVNKSIVDDIIQS